MSAGGAGIVHRFGDNVDTDAIIAARYLVTTDPAELAAHCMETVDPGFAGRVVPGDVIVAGNNFGCGSSREHAPLAIKAAGVSVVIAKSFARIFYRNAFNIGLPILESEEAFNSFDEGSQLQVDLESGEIRGGDREGQVTAKPIPPFMTEIVQAGGLVAYIKNRGSL